MNTDYRYRWKGVLGLLLGLLLVSFLLGLLLGLLLVSFLLCLLLGLLLGLLLVSFLLVSFLLLCVLGIFRRLIIRLPGLIIGFLSLPIALAK